MAKQKSVYSFFVSIFLLVFIAIVVYFLIILEPGGPPKGDFIFPGPILVEWLVPITIFPFVSLLTAILFLRLLTVINLKLITRRKSKKGKIGMSKINELAKSEHIKIIFRRSLILAFFICNIAYTLASIEPVIEFFRSVNPAREYKIPDVDTFFQLAWIIAIPCTILITPLWMIKDTGLFTSEKKPGLETELVHFASHKPLQLIKGYAGLGFIYNFLVMVISWGISEFRYGGSDIFTFIMQLTSPITIIVFMFPVVMFVDSRKEIFRKVIIKHLQKIGANNNFEVQITADRLE